MDNPELLTAVFEHAIDGIIVIDRRGTIQLANPAVCALFAYLPAELPGQSISLLMEQAEAGRHDGYLEQYQQTGVPVIIGKGRELNGRRKDGSVFPFRLAVSEFRNAGEIFYAGILHDLSREKQAESSLIHAQEQNRVKTRLVSMASHEFRSPLSRIQLSASLIERYYQRLDQDKIMDHIRKIKLAVEDMTDTLNDFLSIERIEAGNMQPERKSFDLTILAEDLTEQMQTQVKSGQRIIYRHKGTVRSVQLDRTLLRHCLVNLLANAVKYSDESAPIKFDTSISRGNCTISISDQGIGIPPADQPRLFEAFFRAGNTVNIPGTGLGLNIVKNYVNLMNGTIGLKSKEGTGTVFTIKFNLQPPVLPSQR